MTRPATSLLRSVSDPVAGGRIVDELGREVLLRGVNVNSFVDYWAGNDFPTVFPFDTSDMDRIAEMGWNVVRLLFSWSRVEPAPGEYNDDHLDELATVVEQLAERGIYTVLDSHQDAWGPTLAARPDEVCPDDSIPANGWNGAPGWATLVGDDVSRCAEGGIRELSPAVLDAWKAFFRNDPGPDGVGIRTRHARMWGHVAARFAHQPAVAGYDLLNEPNAFSPRRLEGLASFYSEATAEIRAAEHRVGGPPHIIVFEPSGLWSETGTGAPPAWEHDGNVVYSPHIYQGAFNGDPITREAFVSAVEEVAEIGGHPIFAGEWGTATENHHGTQRTGPDGDGYFLDHQRWQDEFRISAAIWEWSESYGDPHKVKPGVDMSTVPVAGMVDVDWETNEIIGERHDLIHDLLRPYPKAAPGALDHTFYDPATGEIVVRASAAPIGAQVVIFYPGTKHGTPRIAGEGLGPIEVQLTAGGNAHIVAETTHGDWSLVARC